MPLAAPTARVPSELIEMAFIRAVRGTMSVINPCIAGISNELTTPPIATRRKIGHGLETPSIATRAIARIAVALIDAVTCKTLFLGKSVRNGAADWRSDQGGSASDPESSCGQQHRVGFNQNKPANRYPFRPGAERNETGGYPNGAIGRIRQGAERIRTSCHDPANTRGSLPFPLIHQARVTRRRTRAPS